MKNILWVEDDPPERFVYEEGILRSDGWRTTWAPTVAIAADLLSKQRFDAIILDQMLPVIDGVPVTIWGGCCLLHWLRGNDETFGATPHDARPALPDGAPHAENRALPVVIVSAFRNKEVLAATMAASSDDSTITRFLKPVDIGALRKWFTNLGKEL